MSPPADDALIDGEAHLISGLQAGREEAFRELVTKYTARLLPVARRFLQNEEDARDALQDAFFQAFRGIEKFKGESRLGTWLHRIVVNASLMRIRKTQAKREESIEDLLPRFVEDGHQARPATRWGEPADRSMLRDEIRSLVKSSIKRLPPNYRNVILLRDIEELSTAEAASALGVTENTVKVRLHRARQALRELIDPRMRRV